MSIWIDQVLAAATTTATTTAVTRAATRNTIAPSLPVSTYALAIGEMAAFLAVGVAVFLVTYGRRPLRWSAVRARGRDAAFQLCLTGGAMIWCFLALPPLLLLTALPRTAATTRAVSDGTQVIVYAITCLVGLALAGLLHWAFRRANTIRMLGVVPLREKWMPGRLLVAAMIAVPFTYLVATVSLLVWQALGYEHDSAHQMLQLMERNERSPWVLWLTIFNATLLAPIFEETLFRGHLQTLLGIAFPKSRVAAIVVTSFLFAGIHDAWTAPAIFALSLAIGIAYEWTGSLFVAIGIHIAFNAMSTLNFLVSN